VLFLVAHVHSVVPFGIAFGILRGACHVPGCTCDAYKTGALSSCTCGHFPASHKNLGPADILDEVKKKQQMQQSLDQPVEEVSQEPLVKKSRDQLAEFVSSLSFDSLSF